MGLRVWYGPVPRLLGLLLLLCAAAVAAEPTCSAGSCTASWMSKRLKVSLAQKHGLVFCQNCSSPESQGSHVDVWESQYAPKGYKVEGELVYTVPNDADGRVLNAHSIEGNIALVDRGKIPMVEKIEKLQEAGATAVVIVDDGSCKGNFDCGMLGSRSKGKFAYKDRAYYWRNVQIPSVLMKQTEGDRLKSMMNLETMQLKNIGLQYLENF